MCCRHSLDNYYNKVFKMNPFAPFSVFIDYWAAEQTFPSVLLLSLAYTSLRNHLPLSLLKETLFESYKSATDPSILR